MTSAMRVFDVDVVHVRHGKTLGWGRVQKAQMEPLALARGESRGRIWGRDVMMSTRCTEARRIFIMSQMSSGGHELCYLLLRRENNRARPVRQYCAVSTNFTVPSNVDRGCMNLLYHHDFFQIVTTPLSILQRHRFQDFVNQCRNTPYHSYIPSASPSPLNKPTSHALQQNSTFDDSSPFSNKHITQETVRPRSVLASSHATICHYSKSDKREKEEKNAACNK